MSHAKSGVTRSREVSAWGRLCLGVVGGYTATTLLLAALAGIAGPPRGEWVNWALILAPFIATFFLAHAFAARSLFSAARGMAAVSLLSAFL